MGRQTYFAAVLLLLLFGSNAQAFRLFHHLAVKDGLPSYQTYVVAQDKQGLIWVGTENGLARYDGYKIKVYQHSPSNATSLSANVVRCLLVDSHGRLWVGTDGGLDLFDAKHDSFSHITNRAKDLNGTSASSISALAETRTGNILVGTNGDGLIFLDRSGKIIKHYRHDSSKPLSLSNNSVRALYVDKDNSIWIGTRNGLNKFNRNKDYFQHYSHTKSTHSLS
ncbi:MAG: ligand-binding sensor domain-containing protein, partial [Candidatus Saccharimonadales bacterium]